MHIHIVFCVYTHTHIYSKVTYIQTHIKTCAARIAVGLLRAADLQFVATQRTHQPTHHFLSTVPWKTRAYLSVDQLENSSVSVCRSTFRVSFHGSMQRRPRNRLILPKLSFANSFNNVGKLDRQLSKLWASCRFFNKRDHEKRCTGKLSAAN